MDRPVSRLYTVQLLAKLFCFFKKQAIRKKKEEEKNSFMPHSRQIRHGKRERNNQQTDAGAQELIFQHLYRIWEIPKILEIAIANNVNFNQKKRSGENVFGIITFYFTFFIRDR